MAERQGQFPGAAEKKEVVSSPASSPRKADSNSGTPRKQQSEESPPSSPESKNSSKKSIAQLIDNAIKSRKADTLTTRLVTDKAGLFGCVEALKKESVIAVDSEGINLSRDGELCVLQIASHSSIYLIDVVTLSQDKCWKTECVPQLNALLSSNEILKLLYDCRNDSDALWHQHGIRLNFVLDLQLLEIARRRQEKLQVTRRIRLVHAIEYRFRHSEDNIQRMRELDGSVRPLFEKFDALKNEGKAKHEDHPWVYRPMSKDLLGYAASGVVWLLDLAFLHISALRKQKGGWIGRVMNASTDALLAFRDSPKMIERTSELAKAPHI